MMLKSEYDRLEDRPVKMISGVVEHKPEECPPCIRIQKGRLFSQEIRQHHDAAAPGRDLSRPPIQISIDILALIGRIPNVLLAKLLHKPFQQRAAGSHAS